MLANALQESAAGVGNGPLPHNVDHHPCPYDLAVLVVLATEGCLCFYGWFEA